MTIKRLPRCLLWLSLLCFLDCTCGSLGDRCVPGQYEECACDDGQIGFQVCASNGIRFSECVCIEPPDSNNNNNNEFRVIDLSINPAHTMMAFQNLAPGDQVQASVQVGNTGGDDLRYAMTSISIENHLAGKLQLTVDLGSEPECNTTSETLYGPAALGSLDGKRIIGDPQIGEQTGDRVLLTDSDEILCLMVQLPPSTGNEFQGLSTAIALSFVAEQLE